MTYNEHTGERVVYRAKISLWNFTLPVILLLIYLAMPSGSAKGFIGLLAIIGFVVKAIEQFTTELYIGEKFIVAKYGLIRRETIELLNSKVEVIKVNQGIIGRILNFGDITIVGTGGTKNPIRFISSPVAFRNAWMNMQ